MDAKRFKRGKRERAETYSGGVVSFEFAQEGSFGEAFEVRL